MKKRIALTAIALLAGAVALSCRQSDERTFSIDVPAMSDAKSVRIVTNAALDEVVGEYDGIQNEYEIDFAKSLVIYHEGERLLSPDYRHHIEARIAEVGFGARVIGARLNPPAPVQTADGQVQMWPGRVTAVISVPDMKRNTDANIVVDAIAYARIGHDDPRISVDRPSRRITATYESLCLSLMNIEYAIACAGFAANNTPANLGRKDSLPHGWTPITP